MAKKNQKSRRQSIVSKVANGLLILLGLSRPISLFFKTDPTTAVNVIIDESTFGLTTGGFNLAKGLQFYAPAGAAAAVGFLKSFLMRKFPVRR